MDSLWQDVRYSLRALARRPGFVTAVVLSLALGLGVNTAIFSALDALLLRPLPLRDADRTVYVFHAAPDNPDRGTNFPAYERYRDRTETFSAAMAFSGARPLLLSDGDRRDQLYAELVTADFFTISTITLRAGRPFGREIERVSDPPFVAILSDRCWQRRFASDPAIVGKTIVLNGRAFAVAGVAAEGFTGFDREISADLWIPLTTWAHLIGEPSRLTGEEHWITMVAQLRPGVTVDQARSVMTSVGQAARQSEHEQTRVRSARETSPGSNADTLAIGAAAMAVGLLVLALAGMNVTSLLIARAAARQKEMSVRLALGGSRIRLIRAWVIECLLLSVAAGAIGLVVAWWALDLATAFKPPAFIGQSEAPTLSVAFRLDYRLFAFALALSVLVALAVGGVSGLQASKPGALRQLKADRRFAPGLNVRSLVIASQMAVSLLLLIPCGLFVRSWLGASSIEPGFAAENVLLLPISDDQAGVRVQKPPRFEQNLIDRVSALPGVAAVTAMDPVPLWFGRNAAHFRIEDRPQPERFEYASIAPQYFATLRLPLIGGRDFAPADDASAPAVAIVNETMARRFWPDGGALGARLRSGNDLIEVVGIAKTAKYSSLAGPAQPFLYRPLAQVPTNNASLSLAVRATGNSSHLRDAIEREVRALIPSWPQFTFRTLDEGLKLQQLLPRAGATLLGVLGVVGLLLSAVGMYGVMAFVVRQRTREIGIRLALGSPGARVVALVVRQGMTVCLAGAICGLALALGASQLLSTVLYGVSPLDPWTYIVVPAIVLAVATLACYLPARHAATLNPLDALRRE